MSDLKVGEKILSVNSRGEFVYSEVLIFLDRDPSVERVYYRVKTETGKEIRLTESHLIFASQGEPPPAASTVTTTSTSTPTAASTTTTTSFSSHSSSQPEMASSQSNFSNSFLIQSTEATFASLLQPGMYLHVAQSSASPSPPPSISFSSEASASSSSSTSSPHSSIESDDRLQLSLEKVVSVQAITGHGAYAPLTREGNLVVNRVVASCYAVIEDHKLAHLAFLPVRLWFNILDSLSYVRETLFFAKNVNIVKSRNSKPIERSDSRQSVGIHWYPRLLYTLAKYVINVNALYS